MKYTELANPIYIISRITYILHKIHPARFLVIFFCGLFYTLYTVLVCISVSGKLVYLVHLFHFDVFVLLRRFHVSVVIMNHIRRQVHAEYSAY